MPEPPTRGNPGGNISWGDRQPSAAPASHVGASWQERRSQLPFWEMFQNLGKGPAAP